MLGAVQGAFQEAGGRTIEVTNREYQLRGGVSSESIDKLEFLVLGRDRRRAGRCSSRTSATCRSATTCAAALPISTAPAKSSAASPSWSRDATCWPSRERCCRSSTRSDRRCPEGIEIVPTYDRSALIWDTLTNFFQALVYELIVVILVIAVALKNVRAAVAPICVLLLGTLFTALPLVGVRPDDQPVLAGRPGHRHRRDGRRDDRHRRELHRAAGQAPATSTRGEKLRTIIQATATMTRPLLFSMLIIVTSFLPIFFLGEREGRLFNPLAFSKTFAMAFSTLLTLFLLPVVIVWIFRRDVAAG